MGRLAKKGLEYFPMDIDMFQDIRIRKLIKYQGGAAVSVYTLLLCLIYKDGYYMRWDNELPFIMSELSGLEENHISEVIKCCLSIGLFDKNLYDKEKILTSRSIQQRYCNIKRLNKRLTRIDEYKLIDTPPSSSAKKTGTNIEKTSKKKLPPKDTNAQYLRNFFSEERSKSLLTLCKNLGFRKCDLTKLRQIADEIISEWELADLTHTDFSDWSRHLISTMKIKVAGQPPAPDTPETQRRKPEPIPDPDEERFRRLIPAPGNKLIMNFAQYQALGLDRMSDDQVRQYCDEVLAGHRTVPSILDLLKK